MKKLSVLAASVAIALTGCGGSDGGSSDSTPAPGGLVITAIDGYLQQAQIWVDEDGNRSNGCELNTGELTDENGQATISKADFAGMDVCIKAVANTTIDKDRGLVASDFTLASLANDHDQIIVNPMTNIVVEKVKSQLAGDPTLDVVAAKKAAEDEVVAAVTQSGSGLKADAAMIFGDYIANSSTSDKAKALKVIGETLVDHKDQSVEKQLAITTAVAEKTQEIINSNTPEEIDDFAPEINVSGDGTVTVTKNSRPVVSKPLTPVTMQLSDAFTSMDASQNFNDAEGDTLTFSMQAIGGNTNGLAIDATTGVITGKPKAAGEFIYQIFAEDAKGSLSYPATLTVTIETPNSAPVVNDSVKAELQALVSGWQWVQGEQPLDTLSITALFEDADSDVLTYTVETSLSQDGGVSTGFQVLVDGNNTIAFDGLVPYTAAAGAESIYVYANDGVNAEDVLVTLSLPEIAEGTVTPPPIISVADLEDKFLHYIEVGSNNTNYTSAWCNSIYIDSISKQVLWNKRTDQNKQTCVANDLANYEAGFNYVIEDGAIKSTNYSQDGMSIELVNSSIYDGEMLNHYLIKYNELDTEADIPESKAEIYSYYTDNRAVENRISQPIGTTMDNAPWSESVIHTVISGEVKEFDVSGIVQQFDYTGSDGATHTYTSASLYANDPHACDVLKNDYTVKVMGSNDAAGSHFINLNYKSDNGCYVDLLPYDMTTFIPSGLYTIEAKPKQLDQGERVIFSFKK
ncbi:TPA: hypothetical protein NJ163_003212 [Vibrio parahaemolyticus]|nr:hypothetical protein [Vibrio parahaemolyticus]